VFRFLVFHGGSGSSKEEINTAVGNGVVKMNVDTDMQFAYMAGMRASISLSTFTYGQLKSPVP
jgi:fructose/tagatose bisphosphate aldolase